MDDGEILRIQNIRECIIDYLEWVSSYEEQRQYQSKVPLVHIPHEAINQWEDWVRPEWADTFVPPVFSKSETDAMREYESEWEEVIEITPNPLPPLEQLIGTESWERLRAAAEKAYLAFMQRGHFSRELAEL